MPILESLAASLGSAITPPLVAFANRVGRDKYNEFIALYTNAFQDFVESSLQKCSLVKTLINQEAQFVLKDIYVNGHLTLNGGEPFSDENLLDNLKRGKEKVAITGLAGSGKSMLMRWVALNLIETLPNHQRIPLFIEIRDLELGDKEPLELDKTIFRYCSSPFTHCTFEQFQIGLREGVFVVILDGIDEIDPERISAFLRALARFNNVYVKSPLIASARPGTQLGNLNSMFVYKVEPLRLADVLAILAKAPYNEERKAILVKSLRDGLYLTHKSFLSNPLLVTITLITFDDASKIPDNLTGFYAAAFDALFTKHDWAKGVYTRKRYSGLEKAEFEKIFQYFCYQTYFKSSFSLSRPEVDDVLSKAVILSNSDAEPSDVYKDCVLSTCLLVEEGEKTTFVHRSFQEYFTARFVASYMGPKAQQLLGSLARRSMTDNTFLMTTQLNRELVIRQWGLAAADAMLDSLNELLKKQGPKALLRSLGLEHLTFNLVNGELESYVGRGTSAFDSLNPLYVLAKDNPSIGYNVVLRANAYSGLAFSDLSTDVQAIVRKMTSEKQRLSFNVSTMPNDGAAASLVSNVASSVMSDLLAAKQRMTDYLSERDQIADLGQLID